MVPKFVKKRDFEDHYGELRFEIIYVSSRPLNEKRSLLTPTSALMPRLMEYFHLASPWLG